MLSNATRFQRTTAGLCLILAPLFLLISDLLQTRDPSKSIEELLDAIGIIRSEIAVVLRHMLRDLMQHCRLVE